MEDVVSRKGAWGIMARAFFVRAPVASLEATG